MFSLQKLPLHPANEIAPYCIIPNNHEFSEIIQGFDNFNLESMALDAFDLHNTLKDN